MVHPEDPVVIHPVSSFGYSFDHMVVNTGNVANSTDPLPLTSALTGSADALGNYNGVMPNQNVEITYYYTGAGTGQEFTVAHEDLGTADSLLKNIVPASVVGHATDDTVEGDALTMPQSYGYIFSTHADSPTGVPVAGETTTFNPATKHYKAKMPTGDLKLTYSYTRDASAWSNIQFYSGKDVVGGPELEADVAGGGDPAPPPQRRCGSGGSPAAPPTTATPTPTTSRSARIPPRGSASRTRSATTTRARPPTPTPTPTGSTCRSRAAPR